MSCRAHCSLNICPCGACGAGRRAGPARPAASAAGRARRQRRRAQPGGGHARQGAGRQVAASGSQAVAAARVYTTVAGTCVNRVVLCASAVNGSQRQSTAVN